MYEDVFLCNRALLNKLCEIKCLFFLERWAVSSDICTYVTSVANQHLLIQKGIQEGYLNLYVLYFDYNLVGPIV